MVAKKLDIIIVINKTTVQKIEKKFCSIPMNLISISIPIIKIKLIIGKIIVDFFLNIYFVVKEK